MMSKYGNKKTEVDGILFDSKKEADYYLILKAKQKAGEIEGLKMQVPFELLPAIWEDEIRHLKTRDKVVKRLAQRPVRYIADFVYRTVPVGEDVVVDVKGKRTTEYLLKKKMMYALRGIKIMEV